MKRIKLILNEVQWSLAKEILKEAGVEYSILNEQFASLYPGPGLGAFAREILVNDEDEVKTRELLKEFFEQP